MAVHWKSHISRLIKAAGYSWQGLRAVFATETAFREELLICAIMVPIACIIHVTPVEHALLIGSLFLVLITELANSAIETVINRISTEIHPLSGRAKDIGSAMVLLSLFNAGCIWAIILWR